MLNSTNKNLIIMILLIACGILAGGLIWTQLSMVKKPESNVISKEKAGELALAYINENLLPEGMTANLEGEVVEEGLYKLKLKIDNEEFFSYITSDGKVLFPQGINLEEEVTETEGEEKAKEKGVTLGNFLVSEDEICLEDGKSIIYFFGSQGCPHCTWEHPIVEEVAGKFGDYISFHNNMDSDEDMDVFSKYSPEGYVPALVLGCKYYRVGSGETIGEEEESKVLTALICDLTENQPNDVCEYE